MIAIFAKQPVPGKVKTRLLSHLTPEQAAAVYLASMRDVVERAADVAPVVIHYAGGDHARAFFAELFPGIPLREQVRGDLGDRMQAALDTEFEAGAEVAMILGTDSPTLPSDYLRSALDRASRDDVVFGPSEDGGYYLVAAREDRWPLAAAVFRGIPWSTAEVLNRSLAAAREAGLTAALLPSWYDIDHPPELARACAESAATTHLHRLARDQPDIVDRSRAAASQR